MLKLYTSNPLGKFVTHILNWEQDVIKDKRSMLTNAGVTYLTLKIFLTPNKCQTGKNMTKPEPSLYNWAEVIECIKCDHARCKDCKIARKI